MRKWIINTLGILFGFGKIYNENELWKRELCIEMDKYIIVKNENFNLLEKLNKYKTADMEKELPKKKKNPTIDL